MSLTADGEDGNGLRLEKLRPNFSSCFRALCFPLDVHKSVLSGLMATTNFQDTLGQKSARSP